ncbi:hypothetical protein ABZT04_20190 [Streptomyces sp. NPDC005492]|uniref:hypothetical protein n=1 Tax=Streptomyces sp. NPDC005492 TaxID=3156883 RepID=UPI0033BE256F
MASKEKGGMALVAAGAAVVLFLGWGSDSTAQNDQDVCRAQLGLGKVDSIKQVTHPHSAFSRCLEQREASRK